MWSGILTIIMNLPAVIDAVAKLIETVDDLMDGDEEDAEETDSQS